MKDQKIELNNAYSNNISIRNNGINKSIHLPINSQLMKICLLKTNDTG